ncbi:parallel beta-helix domain-containing protein [Flavihumibacter fluvii]|uniref:parallel beta-helix domain-containing protein n=1 Tax=Flavihumibacter fluvii TaxID=2838157 RepID=UPI001BDEE32C|nr:parallel beta-helix domain-containing protein [Flavihumibacter fluvii]ULQ54464.1 right-handed parallel beta-helix repeat-containing protein [Flavihumibacter fluvii]
MIKHRNLPFFLLIIISTLVFSACNNNAEKTNGFIKTLVFGPGDEDKIMEAFLSIKDSTKIEFKEGRYNFNRLSINQGKNIVLSGAGPEKTVFDFSAQTQGGEGIRITDVIGFTISGIRLQDSKGDLIKLNKCTDVVIDNVHALWHVADSTSGGYAIYPVMCKNVLIDHSYAEGASDAGIYVGQTQGAVVRNCKATKNVAGCEIENTSDAQVYDNEFYNNTAGFLVFDLPGLSQRGGNTKAYNNFLHDNNLRNFAKSGSFGTSWGVGNAAPGSGIIILATSNVELYSNRIINNNSSAIAIASGLTVDDKAMEKINPAYFPISRNINIHDNVMEMGQSFPQEAYTHHMGQMLVSVEQKLAQQDPTRKNTRIPFILYDGVTTNIMNNGTVPNPDSICIKQEGVNIFVNADIININSKNWHPNTDIKPYTCQ